MMKALSFPLAVLLSSGFASAEIRESVVEYEDGDVTLEGFLAYDDAVKGGRPGVLVVHQWTGLRITKRVGRGSWRSWDTRCLHWISTGRGSGRIGRRRLNLRGYTKVTVRFTGGG